MPKAKNVTVIPATLNIHTKTPTKERVRRRVAAYARVSTDSEEQLTSYEAQVDYYTRFIQENPDWDFVEVYTDEGISAVNTKRRDGFNRMIRDALAGKIDLIVTKSVSRFARNTVDSLTTIRKLKEAGCECFFQKENTHLVVGVLPVMEALSVRKGNGIDDKMIMQVRPVQVCGDDHLKPVSPQPSGQCNAQCVGLLRRDLSQRKCLDGVDALDAALFVPLPLSGNHLRSGGCLQTVDTADKALFRFVLPQGIAQQPLHEGLLLRLSEKVRYILKGFQLLLVIRILHSDLLLLRHIVNGVHQIADRPHFRYCRLHLLLS